MSVPKLLVLASACALLASGCGPRIQGYDAYNLLMHPTMTPEPITSANEERVRAETEGAALASR